MPPNEQSPTGVLFEDEKLEKEPTLIDGRGSHCTAEDVKFEIIWSLVFSLAFLHVTAAYGLYLLIFSCMWRTLLFCEYF